MKRDVRPVFSLLFSELTIYCSFYLTCLLQELDKLYGDIGKK